MFTGLVQTQGQLLERGNRGAGCRLSIAHDLGELVLGESIAVNGACLTVSAISPGRFEADCSNETLARTNLGSLPPRSLVHLERALQVGDRLGGHFVTGHVDAQLKLLEVRPEGEAVELTFELPERLRAFVAEKGSITLDGVSLTVNEVEESSLSVMIVPHTQQETHLGALKRGNTVNCEVDVLARYLVHLARLGLTSEGSSPAEGEALERDRQFKQALAKSGML